jgi:hypothetical protein
MRGGRQPAKPDVARPLDGRVRAILARAFVSSTVLDRGLFGTSEAYPDGGM